MIISYTIKVMAKLYNYNLNIQNNLYIKRSEKKVAHFFFIFNKYIYITGK